MSGGAGKLPLVTGVTYAVAVSAASLHKVGEWAGIVEALATVGVAFGVIFAWRAYKRQSEDSRVALLTGMSRYVNEVAKLLVEHPEMQIYFHGGVQPVGADKVKAEAIALTLANALDHVLIHLEGIKGAEKEAWGAYCTHIQEKSPVMNDFLKRNGSWYGEPLLRRFGLDEGAD